MSEVVFECLKSMIEANKSTLLRGTFSADPFQSYFFNRRLFQSFANTAWYMHVTIGHGKVIFLHFALKLILWPELDCILPLVS